MRYVLNRRSMNLDADQVMRRLNGLQPEPLHEYGVRVGGVLYPVKQAFEAATGVSRRQFTTQTARRLLDRLGFEIVGPGGSRPDPVMPAKKSGDAKTSSVDADQRGWPWEGHVQALFAAHLHAYGWLVTAMANTATKAPGVDLLAHKGKRKVGAEVKGWPSKGYADPRRANEVKATQPSTQAGQWFSQGLMKAIMLLDTHPDHESLVVVPDFPRYRDLAARTRNGRSAAAIHVVFISSDGQAESDTWTP